MAEDTGDKDVPWVVGLVKKYCADFCVGTKCPQAGGTERRPCAGLCLQGRRCWCRLPVSGRKHNGRLVRIPGLWRGKRDGGEKQLSFHCVFFSFLFFFF